MIEPVKVKAITNSLASEEDCTEEAHTNAHISVVGNVDEVSVINNVMRAHQNNFHQIFNETSDGASKTNGTTGDQRSFEPTMGHRIIRLGNDKQRSKKKR